MTARLFLSGFGLLVLFASVTVAQDAVIVRNGSKRVITYNGALKDATGTPRFGTIGVTLSLYAAQEGGDPLWRESQTVETDDQGRYTVLIGATEQEGLPLLVFSNREAQWLGVQPQGDEEQPRILLLAVPYALKAADADTIGGKPISSFVLYEDLEQAANKSLPAATIIMQSGVPLNSAGTAKVRVLRERAPKAPSFRWHHPGGVQRDREQHSVR